MLAAIPSQAAQETKASSQVAAASEPGAQTAVEAAGTPALPKLPQPFYCYVSDGILHWGRPEGVAGIYVEFPDPDNSEKSPEAEEADGLEKEYFLKTKTVKTANDAFDITRYIKGERLPQFRVRSVPWFDERNQVTASDWIEPGTYPDEVLDSLGLSGWIYVPSRWFYFKDGVRQHGWCAIGKKTYYLDPATGAMQTGWIYDERKWYYLDEETGELLKNGYAPDGSIVDADGVWTGAADPTFGKKAR